MCVVATAYCLHYVSLSQVCYTASLSGGIRLVFSDGHSWPYNPGVFSADLGNGKLVAAEQEEEEGGGVVAEQL